MWRLTVCMSSMMVCARRVMPSNSFKSCFVVKFPDLLEYRLQNLNHLGPVAPTPIKYLIGVGATGP
jgi:hypothetical protein